MKRNGKASPQPAPPVLAAAPVLLQSVAQFCIALFQMRTLLYRGRLRKRASAVSFIRRTQECTMAGSFAPACRCPTPDPADLAISNRAWERAMQEW